MFLQMHGREETEIAIRRIVRSVRFELLESADAIRLLGPEMSYHHADPYLSEALKLFGQDLSLADVAFYKSSAEHFDLCFEDSWTGYFIAKRSQELNRQAGLVLIHLDDHTDMMPTLLCTSGQTLRDPTSGLPFDPASSDDWEAAILAGSVNIGNFITPFYYSGCPIHVRHVNNAAEGDMLRDISREPCQYDLIPGLSFAAIGKDSSGTLESCGTYLAGPDPDLVLDGAPQVRTLVHIDLDYFINDFNGASRGEDYVPDPELHFQALQKMDRFFQALTRLNRCVDRWFIATSPGFCSAYHWEWLLSELEIRIRRFTGAQTVLR